MENILLLLQGRSFVSEGKVVILRKPAAAAEPSVRQVQRKHFPLQRRSFVSEGRKVIIIKPAAATGCSVFQTDNIFIPSKGGASFRRGRLCFLPSQPPRLRLSKEKSKRQSFHIRRQRREHTVRGNDLATRRPKVTLAGLLAYFCWPQQEAREEKGSRAALPLCHPGHRRGKWAKRRPPPSGAPSWWPWPTWRPPSFCADSVPSRCAEEATPRSYRSTLRKIPGAHGT